MKQICRTQWRAYGQSSQSLLDIPPGTYITLWQDSKKPKNKQIVGVLGCVDRYGKNNRARIPGTVYGFACPTYKEAKKQAMACLITMLRKEPGFGVVEDYTMYQQNNR